MNFSKTTTYALNVLIYMAAREDIRMSASTLSRELLIPYPYHRQILINLSRKCAMHDIWENTRNSIKNLLRQTSLIDLARKKSLESGFV